MVKTGTWDNRELEDRALFFFQGERFPEGPCTYGRTASSCFFKNKWAGYLQQPDHLFIRWSARLAMRHTPGEWRPPSIQTRGWGSAVNFRIRSCLVSWSNPAWPHCWWRTWCPGMSRWAGASPGSAHHWHDQEWAVLYGPSLQPAPAGSWSSPAAQKHNTRTIRHRSRPTAALSSNKVTYIQSDAVTFTLCFWTISSYSSKFETSSVQGLRYSRGWL